MRDFEQEQDFDFDSWQPPTSAIEEQDFTDFTNWIPPTRPIRGASGLGEEVEGKLPPLASEVEKEEFPFTGPMPFSLRENPNRPPTQTPAPEYSRVLDRIGGVASGTADIWGQPYNRPGAPELKELSVFPTDDEQSVLPEMKSEPDTWLGGFGKGLYNEFGRWAANPSTMLSSMEPGAAGAKTALTDILKIGESPAAKLAKSTYNKVRGIKPKTPADVAAAEAELKGVMSEPFRDMPTTFPTPSSVPPLDLSTGIPKPRISAEVFAQMRDARAEQAANAARVGSPSPPRQRIVPGADELVSDTLKMREYRQLRRDAIKAGQTPPTYTDWRMSQTTGTPTPPAPIINREAAGMNPQARPIYPGGEVQNARINPQTGETIIPGITNRLPDPAPISAMPEMDSRVSGVPPNVEPSLSRIEELGQMPVEELESIATPTTLDEVGTPHLGGMTEPIIPESLADEVPLSELDSRISNLEPEIAPVPEEIIIPEGLTDDEMRQLNSSDEFGNPLSEGDLGLDMVDETPVQQEQSLAVIEPEISPAIEPEVMPTGFLEDELNIHDAPAVRDTTNDFNLENGIDSYRQGLEEEAIENARNVTPAPETPPAIESMPEESPWVGEPIVEEPPKPVLSKKEAKAERIAARREKAASKWAGVSKPSEGPAKLLTRGEIGTIESLPKETPTPKPTKVTPIEEMPIGSLPGEEGITEGIITSQDKADFRAREDEMRKALEGKTRASEVGGIRELEERPSWISEEGEEIGVPPEDKETSRAKAEEMKRALEGKQRAGKRMSMPEMGRGGELPKMETPKPSRPKPPTTSEIWQSQVDALDKAKAPDTEYQSILSTGSKTPLRKKETWRERVMGYIDLKKKQEAESGKGFSERLKGEKGALTISKGPSSQPPPPPPFSWKSPSSTGIGSKGPLDVVRESKFGKAVGKAYEESGGKSPWTKSLDVLGNAMKSGMSALDVSGLLRQGGPLIHKKEWREAAKQTVELLKDEKVFAKRMGDIKKNPLFKFAKDSGLELTGLTTTGREEKFANEVMHAIPGYGKLVTASDNAFTGFQNELRFNTFSALLEDAVKAGYKPGRDKGLAKEIASFVNEASGRGSLGTFEPAAKLMNAAFYSPKFGLSRIQLMNRLNPLGATFKSQGKFVRREAVKSILAMVAMNGTANIATAALGGKVVYDLTNSDFMKNKFGNTRVDFGSGFFQPLVLASRILMDKTTSSMTGKTSDLGSGYGQTSAGDLIGRFAKSKEAPIMGAIAELWSGKDWLGRDKNRAIALAERFTPLIMQDLVDILKEDPRMIPLIIPGLAGASVQTYKKPEKKQGLSMPRMGLGL